MYEYVLPSGKTVELREMTGTEEALLTNERLMRDGTGVNQLLRNCIVKLDGAEVTEKEVNDMLSGDRLFCLVRIRQITFGDECSMEVMCSNPKCGASNTAELDLADLEVSQYAEEAEHVLELPKSKIIVTWRPMFGNDERRLAKMDDSTLHDAMLIRIKDIDGKAPSRNVFLGLSAIDLKAIRDDFDAKEGGIDTQVKMVCRKCGSPIVTRLESQPSFFFPKK